MSNSIDFSAYLGDAEMREIAREEYRKFVASKAEADFERVLGNEAARLVWQAVDKAMNGTLDAVIKEKVKGAVTKIGTFEVFRSASVYDREKSVGQDVLDKAITAQADRLTARIGQAIDDADFSDDSLLSMLEGREISFGKVGR